MNGRRGVGEATRARILEAAAELGWSPSAPARALGRGRAGAIGLLLARPVETLEVDPFFLRFLAGVERALARTDHALLLRVLDSDGPVDPAAYERLAAQGRVDGFLLCDVELDDPRFDVLAEAGLPVVVAGRPAGSVPVPGARDPPRGGPGRRHRAPGRARPRADRLPRRPRPLRVRAGAPRRPGGRSSRAAGLRAGPGLRSATRPRRSPRGADRARLHERRARRRRARARPASAGSRSPATSPITGFDDSSLAALSSPPLTSVRIDYAQFGEAAAAALLAAIAGAPPPGFEPAAPRLVVRASTESV